MDSDITLEELTDLAEGTYLLIDVRDDISYRYGTISGARSLPDVLAAAERGELPRSRTLVLFCMHGQQSLPLAEELREPAVYNTILCTMAAGNNKLNDMYHCTGFSRAKISVYLKNLMEIDLVEKTGAGIYRIAKSHIRFYFYFIFPHLSFLESIAPAQFYELFVADAFQEFLRETYREI